MLNMITSTVQWAVTFVFHGKKFFKNWYSCKHAMLPVLQRMAYNNKGPKSSRVVYPSPPAYIILSDDMVLAMAWLSRHSRVIKCLPFDCGNFDRPNTVLFPLQGPTNSFWKYKWPGLVCKWITTKKKNKPSDKLFSVSGGSPTCWRAGPSPVLSMAMLLG